MSEAEYYAEQYEIDMIIFRANYDNNKEKLNMFSPEALIERALVCDREKLNSVSEYFPTYDVALKYNDCPDKLTYKQKRAIANTLAWYLAKNGLRINKCQ